MYRKLMLLICTLALLQATAQQNKSMTLADSLYKIKEYKTAATAYLQAADASKMFAEKKGASYNAACCFALINDTANAVNYLQKAIFKLGYKSDGVLTDADLVSLHHTDAWKKIENYLGNYTKALHDPAHAKLITADFHNFWLAYDAAKSDIAHMQQIFQEQYFDKATPGLEDYITLKIGTIEKFVKNQKSKPNFYAAIRSNTLSIDTMKATIYNYFQKFKSLYADAIFPDIYFLIGRWNSAGTVSDNGLLLGVDQMSKTTAVPTDELDLWEQKNYKQVKDLPVIVIHELVHSQKGKLKQDTTLLSYALREGMADFLAELITGVNLSQRQQNFAADKKKQLWNDFEKEMYLDHYNTWLANADQERPDHPADLGYYIGYEICKSYYNNMPDKRQAVIDILTIQDYKAFLNKSQYAQKIEALL